MTSVQQALEKLNNKIGKLEGSVQGLEGTLSGQQRDMFGKSADRKAMTKRIDSAIGQVEQLLEEAS